MKAEFTMTIPGSPADVVSYFRDAVAAAEIEASADAAAGTGELDASARELLKVDWRQLVPDEGETTTLDIDDHEHFGGKTSIHLEGNGADRTALRIRFGIRFHGGLWLINLVPGRFLARQMEAGVRSAEKQLVEAYCAWTTGALASLPIAKEALLPQPSPHLPTPPSAVGTSPAPWMRWDPETVSANKRGELTTDQLRLAWRTFLIRILPTPFGFALASGSFALLTYVVIRGLAVAVVAGCLFLILLLAIGGRRFWSVAADLRARRCVSKDGSVGLPTDRRSRRLQFGAQLRGLRTWGNPNRLGLIDGARYRMAYLPRSRLVINAEPLAEEPPKPTELTLHWARVSASGRKLVEGRVRIAA